MSQTVHAILDALYRKFLLRDVFAKIIPGMLVMIVWTSALGRWEQVRWVFEHGTFLLWLLLGGTAWHLAVIIQGVGEVIGLIINGPEGLKENGDRYRLRLRFGRLSSLEEQTQEERYTVIAQASGLFSCALLLIVAAWPFLLSLPAFIDGRTGDCAFKLGIPITLLGASAAMVRVHRDHVRKQYDFMRALLAVKSVRPGTPADRRRTGKGGG